MKIQDKYLSGDGNVNTAIQLTFSRVNNIIVMENAVLCVQKYQNKDRQQKLWNGHH